MKNHEPPKKYSPDSFYVRSFGGWVGLLLLKQDPLLSGSGAFDGLPGLILLFFFPFSASSSFFRELIQPQIICFPLR